MQRSGGDRDGKLLVPGSSPGSSPTARAAASAGLIALLATAGCMVTTSAADAQMFLLHDLLPPRAVHVKKHRHVSRKPAELAAKPAAPRPHGPYQIVIAIDKQRLSLYGGSTLIAHAPVSTGMRGHPTPTGVFSVIQKQKWHRSNIYSGAPMPYMQRITWSGIAMHAGVLPGYPASHGCIRMPDGFARELWGLTKLGARVIVARHDVVPFEITDAHLFQPAPPPADPPQTAAAAVGPTLRPITISEVEAATTGSVTADNAKASADLVQPTVAAAVIEQPQVGEPAVLPENPPLPRAKAPPKETPISIFISRKERRIFVRQDFSPVFDAPIDIAEPDQPLGTHVFTATGLNPDGDTMRWVAASLPPELPTAHTRHERGKHRKGRAERPAEVSAEASSAPTAAQALARINVPKEVSDRIAAMLRPGSSLIVSDKGLGPETGPNDTDFIVLTR
jgi:hypothetical protein